VQLRTNLECRGLLLVAHAARKTAEAAQFAASVAYDAAVVATDTAEAAERVAADATGVSVDVVKALYTKGTALGALLLSAGDA